MPTYNICDQYGDEFVTATAKSFRVDKNGTLIIIGKRFKTVAAYPAKQWGSIMQINEQNKPAHS